jgi:serine/threonine protein kinase
VVNRDEAMSKAAGPTPGGAPDPLVGKVVGERFRVLGLVARGGMGKIYKAEQLGLGRIVALKVLAPADRDMDEEVAFQRRFEREASICSRLNHSNTVRIIDFGRASDGVYYIAMEFLEGSTLHAVIKNDAPMDANRVIHVLRQIAGSLAEAHNQGIVHRDLKPGNVLLITQGDDHDFAKVVDFGLVKHVLDKEVTQAGLIVGSPMYMAPEQVRGDNVDHRTDIYALGMMAYVMLTGKRPFERDTPVAVLMARMSARPPTFKEIAPEVAVPSSLEWVVMTALQIDRDQRFESMHEVLRALKVCEAQANGQPGPYTLGLERGRTVLPPEFSDVSISRTRVPALNTVPEAETTISSRAPIAGLSLALAALLLFAVLASGLVLVAGLYMVLAARPGVPPMAEQSHGRDAVAAPVPSRTEPPPQPAQPPSQPAADPSAAAAPVEVPAKVEAPAEKPTPPVRPSPKPKPTVKAQNPEQPAAAPEPAKPAEPDPKDTQDEAWKARSSDVRNPFGKSP